jgi:[protein-PII] uridylyltransferase
MWSPWKETLLRSLVSQVAPQLSETSSEIEDQLFAEVEQRHPEIGSALIHAHLSEMPDGYLARFGSDLVAEHLRLVTPPPSRGEFRMSVIGGAPASTLVVATRDRPALLATVAGVLALRNLTILEARAVTRRDGVAIDTFRVADALGSDMIGQGRWPAVREELVAAINRGIDMEARLEAKRRSYQNSPPATQSEVRVDGRYIDVRTPDRVGLLHDLAQAMADLGLDVQLAKIDTRAGEAIDVFEVANPNDHAPEAIRDHLLRSLDR